MFKNLTKTLFQTAPTLGSSLGAFSHWHFIKNADTAGTAKQGLDTWQPLWQRELDTSHARKFPELYDKAKILDKKLRDFDSICYALHDVEDVYAEITNIIELFKTTRYVQQQLSQSDINFYSRLILESSVFLDSFNYCAQALEFRKLIPCPALREKVLESAEVYKLSPPV